VLVRRVYVNAVASLMPRARDHPVASRAPDYRFGLDRTNFPKKILLGEGIAEDQNVAGMWLKYG
jgi:hypothetical protein